MQTGLIGERGQGLIEVLGRQLQGDFTVLLGAVLRSTGNLGRLNPDRPEQRRNGSGGQQRVFEIATGGGDRLHCFLPGKGYK
ncbi:hypothetical protein D3C78_1824710 [compost metagenome]